MQTDLQELEQQAAADEAQIKRVPFDAVSETKHILVPGVYAKATFVRKNVKFYSKKLPVEHITILAHGEMLVVNGERKTRYAAPATLILPADTRVMCFSLTDLVYYCIHATDETDVEELKKIY